MVVCYFPLYTGNRDELSFRCYCGEDGVTCLKNFQRNPGCKECVAKKKEEKKKKTCLEIYGVENPSQSEAIKEKKKETTLLNYGVEHTFQSEENKEKRKKTYLQNYGVESHLQSEVIKEKIKETCLQNYGVENPFQSAVIKEKIKETCLQKYGVEKPSQSEVIKEKIKETCLQKYGVESPMHNKEIYDRAIKSGFKLKTITLPSGLTIEVQGYEPWYVKMLLECGVPDEVIVNSINDVKELDIWYEMNGTKHRYYPDFYFKAENLIIEVKSAYTLQVEENKNLLKFEACRLAGYDIEIWVFDDKGNVLNTFN